jgi:excisionase family DNA binding protein
MTSMTNDLQTTRLTVSVTEAALLLGIGRSLAYELVARGELPSLRLGRRVLIPRQSLDTLLAAAVRDVSVGR